MPRLRLVLDQILAPVPGGIGRFTEELARALIVSAPASWEVEGIVSRHPNDELSRLRTRLPGLVGVERFALSRRALSLAWQYGLPGLAPSGVVHATSLFAPLYRHPRNAQQQVVTTIHDAVPWTHPETLTPRGVHWHKAMAARTERFADAVVVPTEAIAAELGEILRLGDRVRVIGSAVSSDLVIPDDADARVASLDLPAQYLLAVGTLEPRKGLEWLVRALAEPTAPPLPLLVVGPAGWGDVDLAAVSAAAGLPAGRVRALGRLSDSDLAIAMHRATALVVPSLAEGFGIPVLEAMHFGTPVIHSDAPALVEVAGGAGLTVPVAELESYPARLAAALDSLVSSRAVQERMREAGPVRSAQYSWKTSAEKVWQLHTGL